MEQSRPPVQDKELGAALGVSKGSFSNKIHMTKSSFSIEEFGAIADFFDAPEGSGWPFVPSHVRRLS